MTPSKVLITVAAFFAASIAYAQSVEQYVVKQAAAETARIQKSVENPKRLNGKVTAHGKELHYNYYLNVQLPLQPNDEQKLKTDSRKRIIPHACKELAKNSYGKKGLVMRYRFWNMTGILIDEFAVDNKLCQQITALKSSPQK